MNKKSPSIFILDDDRGESLSMQLMLESRGFHVICAKSVADGRKILREKGYDFDVFVIDMALDKFPDGNQTITGADVIIDFFKESPIDKRFLTKPEQIILTAHPDKIHYYQKAFNLGASAYLAKSNSSDELLRYLRTLSIKKTLNNQSELVDIMESIVLKSHSKEELYENFCIDVLSKLFSRCLGSPYIFLLTESNIPFSLQAKNCIGEKTDLPPGNDVIYDQILAFLVGNADNSEPFVIDDEILKLIDRKDSNFTEEQFNNLKGSAFISLPLGNNFSLNIGLMAAEGLYLEDPFEMAKLLIKFVSYAAITFLAEITARWHKNVAERDTTIRELATFCNNVGSEQLYILENAKLRSNDGDTLDAQSYYEIKSLAADLYHTGRLLEPISERNLSPRKAGKHCMAEILNDSWKEVADEDKLAENIDFAVEGDCQVQCEKEEMLSIAFRLFSWFMTRRNQIPDGSTYTVKVSCSATEDESVVIFEDNSYQIPLNLREKMFDPFSSVAPSPVQDFSEKEKNGFLSGKNLAPTQAINDKHRPGLYLSLYLSKLLIEEKYRGKLRDRSDDLGTNRGHKIEMRMPLGKL